VRNRAQHFVDEIVVAEVTRFLPVLYIIDPIAGVRSPSIFDLQSRLYGGEKTVRNIIIFERLVTLFPREADVLEHTFALDSYPTVTDLERDIACSAKAVADAASRFLAEFNSYEDVLTVYKDNRYPFYRRIEPRLFDRSETLGILYCLTGQRERALSHFRNVKANTAAAHGSQRNDEWSKDWQRSDFATKAIAEIESGEIVCAGSDGTAIAQKGR
jgi:hypothetical protein